MTQPYLYIFSNLCFQREHGTGNSIMKKSIHWKFLTWVLKYKRKLVFFLNMAYTVSKVGREERIMEKT